MNKMLRRVLTFLVITAAGTCVLAHKLTLVYLIAKAM